MVENVFLTDSRREVLRGEYDGAESTEKSKKSHIRTQSKMALDELIEVAHSPEIDNSDVFDPEKLHILIRTLTVGAGGLIGDDVPPAVKAWDPDEDYAREVYVAVDKAIHPSSN